MAAFNTCTRREKLVLPASGVGGVNFHKEPQSLKFLAKMALTPGQLIALPHVVGVEIGQVWVSDCSRDVV